MRRFPVAQRRITGIQYQYVEFTRATQIEEVGEILRPSYVPSRSPTAEHPQRIVVETRKDPKSHT
jgi:hypothetical protein